jgi:hypothetical protein
MRPVCDDEMIEDRMQHQPAREARVHKEFNPEVIRSFHTVRLTPFSIYIRRSRLGEKLQRGTVAECTAHPNRSCIWYSMIRLSPHSVCPHISKRNF